VETGCCVFKTLIMILMYFDFLIKHYSILHQFSISISIIKIIFNCLFSSIYLTFQICDVVLLFKKRLLSLHLLLLCLWWRKGIRRKVTFTSWYHSNGRILKENLSWSPTWAKVCHLIASLYTCFYPNNTTQPKVRL